MCFGILQWLCQRKTGSKVQKNVHKKRQETDQITAGFHHGLGIDGRLSLQKRNGHREQRHTGLEAGGHCFC